MTPSDALRELEALCAAATPGPWTGKPEEFHADGAYIEPYVWSETADRDAPMRGEGRTVANICAGVENYGGNADFIAASRTALPLLLAFLRGEDARHQPPNEQVTLDTRPTIAELEAMLAKGEGVGINPSGTVYRTRCGCGHEFPCPTRLALDETLSKISEGRG